jgi:hypothetical protein
MSLEAISSVHPEEVIVDVTGVGVVVDFVEGEQIGSVRWVVPSVSKRKQKLPKVISSPLPKESKAARMVVRCGRKATDPRWIDSS